MLNALNNTPMIKRLIVKDWQLVKKSLAALQQRFRLPPHRPHPPQRISQHTLQSYDDLLVLHPQAPGGGSRPADPAAAAATGADPLPLAEHRLAG